MGIERDWFGGCKRVSLVTMLKFKYQYEWWAAGSGRACLLSVLLGAGVLGGCAGVAPQSEVGAAETTLQEDAEQPLKPTSEEVMYRVFAGEYLGAEGDLQGAVGEYLAAAMESNDPDIARRATRIALAAESWQEAAMAADRWALLAPESVPAHESAASAMLTVGDYLGAEYQLLKILDLLEDSSDAWVLVARILARGGDPVQADSMLEELFKLRPQANPADVYYARSQLAVNTRDVDQAFELARRAVELSPGRPEFLTWAGRVALNIGLQETGLEYIRRAWELDPENHDLALAYADLLARNGYPDEARRVMEEMQQTPDVMLSRILFELADKKRARAEALFTEFGTMTFSDAQEKAFYQAQAAEALSLRKQAIAFYGQVEEGDRALAAALRRAELIGLEGDLESAREELFRLRQQGDPLVIEQSWLTEARILRELGRRDESFEVLDRALEQLPASVAILYTHSLLAAELGRVDIAEQDLRTILAVQPENAAALNALGYTLADQTERYEEAEALIRQAYILQPNEASIVDSMGWIAYRRGRIDEALQFLKKAWGLDKNAEIAAHLGEVLWVSGQKPEAVQIWRQGREVDADNPVLLETLERLDVEL